MCWYVFSYISITLRYVQERIAIYELLKLTKNALQAVLFKLSLACDVAVHSCGAEHTDLTHVNRMKILWEKTGYSWINWAS